MREFVDDNEGGSSRQRRIDVKFGDVPTVMGLYPARQDFQTIEEGFRLLSAMCFHNPYDNVDTFCPLLLSSLEHRIGLAHTGAAPKNIFSLPWCWRFSSETALSRSSSGSGLFVSIASTFRGY